MTERDVNQFDCADGERITVTVTATGTENVAALALNEQKMTGNTFVINKAANPVSSLTVVMVFTTNGGNGEYTIKIKGDKGPFTYEETIPQDGQKEDARGYEFF